VKILWIGDGGTSTGFSRVCHEIGERLVADYGHSVDVLAIGYDAKTPINTNLRLWAAGMRMGFDRHLEVLQQVMPDLVIFNEDIPFTLRRLFDNPQYDPEQKLYRGPWKLASYTPIDGEGFPGPWRKFPEFVETMPYTKYGAEALGLDRWIYHGVDSDTFHPLEDGPIVGEEDTFTSREQVREKYGIPQDAFVIGRVDSNSGRKDWPSTWRLVEYATEHITDRPVVAVFHTLIKQAQHGVNFSALITRGRGKYIITDSKAWQSEDIAALMNTFDIFVSTTRGEGFGLTVAEALACGVPVLAPRHSSLPEVVGPGGVLVEPGRVLTTPYGHDLRLPDVDTMAQQLVRLAREPALLRGLGTAGLEHVRSTFSWDTAARQWDEFSRSLVEAPIAVGSS